MTHPHDPDLIVSIDDFRASGWSEILAGASEDYGYPSLSSAFVRAAAKAAEEGRREQAKVLRLLSAATSMMLCPGSLNEPFKPFAVFGHQRSAIPDDFIPDDLTLFSQIVDEVDHDLLKARLADLLWLKLSPRNYAHALIAIDRYRSIPLSSEHWYRGGNECWARAFKLALKLRVGAGSRVSDMHRQVVSTILQATCGDKFFTVQLARLAHDHQPSKADAPGIAEKLEALARDFDGKGESHYAKVYYEEATAWFLRLGNSEKAAEMTALHAETLANEANARTSDVAGSQMVANSLYEKAIQVYRDIPARQRPSHRVDERIAELRALQSVAGAKALGEMGIIRTPGIDITDIVEQARTSVSGRTAVDALFALANIHPGERLGALRARVLESMQQFPLQTLFASTRFTRDGRVAAKTPALQTALSDPSEGEDPAVHAAMVRDYVMSLGMTVKSGIYPALEVVQLEHRITESDFVELAKASPITPHGREPLFGKALHAGYEGDFVTALHLLIPQFENMVRIHLKAAGATTATLDPDGIENEIGLSALMNLPQVADVFGDDLAFEFRALFCDPLGPNLRNELAHGLLEPSDCFSDASIYAWWLCLRLIFNSWWQLKSESTKLDREQSAATK